MEESLLQTYLVTGGAGFIGSNMLHFLQRERPGVRTINLDALAYSGNLRNLDGLDGSRHRFVKGDICDRALVTELVGQCDGVLHFAAESHVDRSIQDSSPFIRTNVLGTQVILDVLLDAKRSGASKRMLYVSTDEVYGSLPLDRPDLKFTERTPIDPRSPYAASKAGGDLLCSAYAHTHGLDIVTTRCSNNLGPRQLTEKAIPLFVTNLLQGKQIPLYGDGLNVRDWLHVDDHCSAVLAVMERGRAGEVYNIGGDNERSNLELVRAILGIMGHGESMIRYVEDRLGHDRRYAIDATKMHEELGWRPTRSAWPDALESTIRWYRENEDWWRSNDHAKIGNSARSKKG
ncbi:MAG: dTDP-glucose 4,6-dehydratase [Phycisphaeraceae bacterium]|nr:dTDP-glucose 4,6-dehydratase [Phycisphaerales bacterium]MCB9842551.1 dTDP-glucose 4,6-dehydratase [Phycisphaeraceae bacterium]